jgi:hypothetical protein
MPYAVTLAVVGALAGWGAYDGWTGDHDRE